MAAATRTRRQLAPPLPSLLVPVLLACCAASFAAAASSAGGLRGRAASSAAPCRSCYHSTDEVLGAFREAAARAPRFCRYDEFRGADDGSGRTLPVVTLTDGDVPAEQKERVLLVFGEVRASRPRGALTEAMRVRSCRADGSVCTLKHSREVITSEVALGFARALLDALGVGDEHDDRPATWDELAPVQEVFAATPGLSVAATQAAARGGPEAAWRAAAANALARLELVLVPVENVPGRRDVEAGKLCDRVIASTGVDLNRNWPHMWQKDKRGRRSETYGGPEPLSEFESKSVLALAKSMLPLKSYVNVHSGEWAMYVPWDHKKVLAGEADGLSPDAVPVLHAMNRFCRCKAGAAGAVSGYLAFGTSMDYMMTDLKVPYPITVEVFGDHHEGRTYWQRHADGVPTAGSSARRRQLASVDFLANTVSTRRRCYEMFNPLTQVEYRGAVADWTGALLVWADRMAGSEGLPVLEGAAVAADPPAAVTSAVQQKAVEPMRPSQQQQAHAIIPATRPRVSAYRNSAALAKLAERNKAPSYGVSAQAGLAVLAVAIAAFLCVAALRKRRRRRRGAVGSLGAVAR